MIDTPDVVTEFVVPVLAGLAIGALAAGSLLMLGYALRDAWRQWWRPIWVRMTHRRDAERRDDLNRQQWQSVRYKGDNDDSQD